MPPRKDSSVFSLDELPNLDFDIDSKQAADLAQINDEDIINSQTLCTICADKGENKDENEEKRSSFDNIQVMSSASLVYHWQVNISV